MKNRNILCLLLAFAIVLTPGASHARYYKPDAGRFWTMDSYEGGQHDPQSLHKYLYAHGNPVNRTDPSGHESIGEALTVVQITFTFSHRGDEVFSGARMRRLSAPRRPLTSGEISLSKTIYGESVDYSTPKVEYGKWAFWQPTGREMTPDGIIHTGGETITDYTVDGAKPGWPFGLLRQKGILIHEMCHVWQYQHGINVVLQGLYRVYEYAGPNFGKLAFGEYGIEQEAQMTEDYFYLRNGRLNDTMPAPTPSLETYEKILPFVSAK